MGAVALSARVQSITQWASGAGLQPLAFPGHLGPACVSHMPAGDPACCGGHLSPLPGDHGVLEAGPGQGFMSQEGRGRGLAGGAGSVPSWPTQQGQDLCLAEPPVALQAPFSLHSELQPQPRTCSHEATPPRPTPPALWGFNNPNSLEAWMILQLSSTAITTCLTVSGRQ